MEDFYLSRALFRTYEIKDNFANERSMQVKLKALTENGRIEKIKNGLYATVNSLTGDIFASRFEIASALFENACVAYHSALEFYGLGKKLLEMWFNDLKNQPNKPLGFFCTGPLALYKPYGFRSVKDGETLGPLYLPVGNSPATYKEFCEMYYEPSDTLFCKKATVEWRHEIDCLLKFVFYDRGLDFNIGNVAYLEAALLYNPNQAKVIFTDKGRCVGWALGNEIRLHPDYDETKIQWIE